MSKDCCQEKTPNFELVQLFYIHKPILNVQILNWSGFRTPKLRSDTRRLEFRNLSEFQKQNTCSQIRTGPVHSVVIDLVLLKCPQNCLNSEQAGIQILVTI